MESRVIHLCPTGDTRIAIRNTLPSVVPVDVGNSVRSLVKKLQESHKKRGVKCAMEEWN
jgi:hypothetical protein